jgi:cobalt-zinc-cadmium efflux system outer membrane protein
MKIVKLWAVFAVCALMAGAQTENPALDAAKLYFDGQNGVSANALARVAWEQNGELQAARLEAEKARARLKQAGLRPNPVLQVERTTGRFVGNSVDSGFSVGVNMPLERGQKRLARITLAEAELRFVEAEILEKERRLAAEVLQVYASALAAWRELETLEEILRLDMETTRFVQIRVNEGETAPLELNLLQAEVERLRAKRTLAEASLRAALSQLRMLAGLAPEALLRVREKLTDGLLREPPASLAAATDIALRERPDFQLAKLAEELAAAGQQAAIAQARFDWILSGSYSFAGSSYQDLPFGQVSDRSSTVTFGVSIPLPVFNKNNAALQEEAAVSLLQAGRRRAFLENVIRNEVAAAFNRYESSNQALFAFEQGVINRTKAGIQTIRGAYELGEFRILDLLQQQRRLWEAQQDLTAILTLRYRAQAELLTAIGAKELGK